MNLIAPDSIVPPKGDFGQMNARLQALRAETLELRKVGFKPDPGLSEAENSRLAAAYHEKMRLMVCEQLTLLATLRKTSSGPSKAGGKRAKKAPLDLAALEDSVFE